MKWINLIQYFFYFIYNIMNIITPNNKIFFAIVLFLTSILIIHYLQPSVIYNKDGSFKNFGVGYKNFTVLPMWVFVIIIAIFSYMTSLYFSFLPRIKF